MDKTRCRDRYIVIDVNNGCCTVQKFVKSQLRSKKYQLKLTEVYPVSPDLIEIPGRIRDLDVETSEIEEEGAHNSQIHDNHNISVPNSSSRYEASAAPDECPVVYEEETCAVEEVVDSGLVGSSESLLHNYNPEVHAPVVEVSTEVPVNSGSVRPRREVSKPAWMRSGDYEME